MAIIDAIATVILYLGQGLSVGLVCAGIFSPLYILILLDK